MTFDDNADALFGAINTVFGTSATYTYAADSSTSAIEGVFDNAYIEVDNVITKKPVLKNVKLSDLTAEPVEGDQVTINSITYVVRNHEPDSFGTTTLILQRS